jgi:hypothetical protein
MSSSQAHLARLMFGREQLTNLSLFWQVPVGMIAFVQLSVEGVVWFGVSTRHLCL